MKFHFSTILFINIIYYINILKVKTRHARCFMIPDKNSGVSGEVNFSQESENDPVMISAKVYGAKAVHGFHIHEKGSIEQGCMSAGAHFNPTYKDHGGLNGAVRHVGDMGNLISKDGKAIIYEFSNPNMSLFGNDNIVGRTCVIHANEDDLGKTENLESKVNGNSGPRLACGIVQTHDPLYSLIFGIIVLALGISLAFYYFVYYKRPDETNSNLAASEVKNI